MKNAQYTIHVTAKDEAPNLLITSNEMLFTIKPSTYTAFILDFALKELQTDCKSDIETMTNCINDHFDEMFGNDFMDIIPKVINKSMASFHGLDSFQKVSFRLFIKLINEKILCQY